MAVQCILQQADRVLLKATECGSEGHYALRDAFTAMILAGIPPGFRLAIAFQNLQGDLRRLDVNAALFSDEAKAVAWLRARKPGAQVHAPAPQQTAKRPHAA